MTSTLSLRSYNAMLLRTGDVRHRQALTAAPKRMVPVIRATARTGAEIAPKESKCPVKRILPLLSELVEIQAITSTFETIAGRSAMIGFAAAAAAEILLPHQAGGLFGAWEQAQVFGILVLCLCSASAALALKSPMKIGRSRLLEPVLASLTSESRSAGAITRANVDRALDSTLDSVFNPVFVRTVFPIEIEFQLNTMDGLESDMDAEDIPLF